MCSPPGLPAACCPDDWIKIQRECFYFSKAQGDWTNGQNSCSSLNASLAWIDSPEVLGSLLPYPGKLDHWIGLRKDTVGVWRWVNGTEFDHRFQIQGGAYCVYLDKEVKVISSSCSTERKWICSKL
uniref:C-type lectin domain-containing protein n=1 Tax=Pelodiscus sinensis TaxID=13735 RepID=K7G5T7_PELSI